MLGQMGIGFGGIASSLISPFRNDGGSVLNNSPNNSVGSNQAQNQTVSLRSPIEQSSVSPPIVPSQPSTNSVLPDTGGESLDIGEALQSNKELSLAYQIMRAIARMDGSVEGESVESGSVDGGTGEVREFSEFQLSYQFSMSAEEFSFTQASGGNGGGSGRVTETRLSGFQLDFSLDFSMEISEDDNSVSLSMAFEFSQTQFSFESFRQQQEEQVDPLILNLTGSEFSFDQSLAVSFDLDANGDLDQFFAPGEGNYFLALDRNSNGLIDNGLELFGDAGGATDGFEALRQFDLNQDNQIDFSDDVFNQLKLFSFSSTGNQAINSLSDFGIQSISLANEQASKTYFDNNQLIGESDFNYSNGSKGRVGDFLITVR